MLSRLGSIVLLLLVVFGATRAGSKKKEKPAETTKLDLKQGAIANLNEWKWEDIARECEEFLGPKGYVAVQTSPPHENLIVENRPMFERLRVVSYQLISRSGNETQLADMLKRCNQVGVRVLAHAVINHMTEDVDVEDCKGVGGSTCDPKEFSYPAVPYTREDFMLPACEAKDMSDLTQMKECEIFGYHKLNQTRPHVHEKVVGYLNHLLRLGFAGFRIDAAMHMWPRDLHKIYEKLNNLNPDFGFPKHTRPFIYHEISFLDAGEAVSINDYLSLGLVTDARYQLDLSTVVQSNQPFHLLRNMGFVNSAPDSHGVVFVDTYETEQGRTNGRLNYQNQPPYKIALAFLLGWGHGTPLILSSYEYDYVDDGPPSDQDKNILSPHPIQNNVCQNGWVCQHRWQEVYAMVEFNRVCHGEPISSWWDNGKGQMAFSRGNKGFMAFNMDEVEFDMRLKTFLPAGKYCDIIAGSMVDGSCTGKTIVVDAKGYADVKFDEYDEEGERKNNGMLAFFDHDSSKEAGATASSLGDTETS